AAPSVAVVGSRSPTAQGADNARAFAAALSADGLVVVSGLALGIDGAAHEGALAGGAGTLAVVGTGLDRVFPPRHRELAHRIAGAGERGALISEYAPGTPALPAHFPQRNRIIAGLSLGTLVVEAALRSGSLITARLAAEAGRDVFAVPGSIHSPQSRGCHALIQQGAQLVQTAADIVDALRLQRPAPPVAAAGDEHSGDPILAALGQDPVTLDALISRTGWPAHELTARLLELELDGRAARLPGGLYQRRNIT
ncbi:MAG: DNA-processing protein DprA, partial [Rubrivivax sp.]|nr:DNA-processing protein DprA [Rubrivivax sp.]